MKYLNLEFGNTKTVIELANTPAARQWEAAYTKFVDFGSTYKVEVIKAAVHAGGGWAGEVHPGLGVTRLECVERINDAIDTVNMCIEGTPFPFRASLGMTWEDLNNLHRGFTTGCSSLRYWDHGMTNEELFEFKKLSYEHKPELIRGRVKRDFTVVDEEKFLYHIERINTGVHNYEAFMGSGRATKIVEDLQSETEYIELDWDNFLPTGHRTSFFGERLNYKDLKDSFVGNYEDYDVFIGKTVTGKDYEFAYCQYDNGLEYDITNIDYLNGDIRLHYDKALTKFYTDSDYSKWIDTYKLTPELHLPVPLGKIVDTNVEFKNIGVDYESSTRLSNGMFPLKTPFNSVKSYITEEF